jgi:hypothetical protein
LAQSSKVERTPRRLGKLSAVVSWIDPKQVSICYGEARIFQSHQSYVIDEWQIARHSQRIPGPYSLL